MKKLNNIVVSKSEVQDKSSLWLQPNNSGSADLKYFGSKGWSNVSTGTKNIVWTETSKLSDFIEPGIYVCENAKRYTLDDELPITNVGEHAGIGFTLIVNSTVSNPNDNHHQLVGQTLILTNRLGGETKQYIRSLKYTINNAATPPYVTENTWSAWKELQGTTYLGQVTKAQLDTVIENGIYTGVVTDNELLPQGSTFTLIVLNNYAVNSAVGMPAQARQVSQTFVYLPLADVSTGTIKSKNGQILRRTGIGGEGINWEEIPQIMERGVDYKYYNYSSPTNVFNINTQSTRKLVVVHSQTTNGILINANVSWLKIGETVNFEIVDTVFTDTDEITFNGQNTYRILGWNDAGEVLKGTVLHAYISITRTSQLEANMLCQCEGYSQLNPTIVVI